MPIYNLNNKNIEKFFDSVFNNRYYVPLYVENTKKYDTYISKVNKNTLSPEEHPELLSLILDGWRRNKYEKSGNNIDLNMLHKEYAYFILNAVRFGKSNKLRRQIYKYLGLQQYMCRRKNGYTGEFCYDVRIYFRFVNEYNGKLKYTDIINGIDLQCMKFYIENLYYINRLTSNNNCGIYITDEGRKQALKNMKVTSPLNEEQSLRFNEFVNISKFVELINIIKHVVGKYYITGSIIDYMNNTSLDPKNYTDSDIDILVTNKLKFQLLAGYLTKATEPDNDAIEYTGNRINIKAEVYSHRPIQIYYDREKHLVFDHHFPCVRGYINSKGSMALSQQAIDIFRPDSPKKVKYVFMFPYTDSEKAKSIIMKYYKRGYSIEGIDYDEL